MVAVVDYVVPFVVPAATRCLEREQDQPSGGCPTANSERDCCWREPDQPVGGCLAATSDGPRHARERDQPVGGGPAAAVSEGALMQLLMVLPWLVGLWWLLPVARVAHIPKLPDPVAPLSIVAAVYLLLVQFPAPIVTAALLVSRVAYLPCLEWALLLHSIGGVRR